MTAKKSSRPTPESKYTLDAEVLNKLLSQLETYQNRANELVAELNANQKQSESLQGRLNVFQRLVRVGLVRLDRRGRILEINDSARELLGGKASPIGQLFIAYIARPGFRSFQNHLINIITAPVPAPAATVQVTLISGGCEIPVILSTLRQGRNDEVEYLIALTDRSELTSVELNLQQSLEQLHSIIRSVADVIVFLSNDGKIMFTNRPWLGVSSEEMAGSSFIDLIPTDEQEKVWNCLRTATRYGSLEACEVQFVNRPLQPWFSLRFGPVTTEAKPLQQSDTQWTTLIIRDITNQKRAEQGLEATTNQLRRLSARAEQIREDERRRIAREIHDELGQTLTVLKMDLSWLRARMAGNVPPVLDRMNAMDESLDGMIQTVRRIASELRPPMLSEFGLVAALEWQLEQFQARAGVHCSVKIRPSEVALDDERSIAVFRVVQEALTNVARHSGATELDFYLDVRDSAIVVSIKDNGKGIRKADIKNPMSLGLGGMRERIARVGGDFEVAALREGGTRISIRVPIASSTEASTHTA